MKTELLHLLEIGDFEQIAALASRKKRVLSLLTALTYHPSNLIGWRAVTAMGGAAHQVAKNEPEYVRVHLRRLNWLVCDESGGVGWRAPETIGEILYRCPGQFDEFIPLLLHFLDLEPEDAVRFRAGTLWAIGRVGSLNPALVSPVVEWIIAVLRDSDPQSRGMAVWCLDRVAYNGPIPGLSDLLLDNGLVTVYQDGELSRTTVSILAAGLVARSASNRRVS